MKVIAMYLPQFHRVKENDEWWGDGYTEWTAVKGARQLFDGHYQPRIPQNQNYYDLLEKDTMLWQASLMKQYSVDGVCMYHYWFRDGRRILEKPAENLLQWKDVDMPFCFCWANETWARTWSKIIKKNIWASIYEKEEKDTSNGVLLEQNYGNEQQWKMHFDYLLPFFQDDRYIRVEGKPLFVIYKTAEIPCLTEMLECWEKLALLHGLNGIYVIGAYGAVPGVGNVDAELQMARAYMEEKNVLRETKTNNVSVWEYDDIWREILDKKGTDKTYYEGLVDYDDSPRRGSRGRIAIHATPEKFSHYLTELMAKSSAEGKELLFLNAWNEWGEGMYLEPDEKYGEDYLKAVLYAKEHYRDEVDKYVQNDTEQPSEHMQEQLETLSKYRDKILHYLHLMDFWMTLRENGVSVGAKILSSGYGKVAIYGYGIPGRHLCSELLSSKVEVQYIIDRQRDKIHADVPVYLPEEMWPEAEVVIVAATYHYAEIYQFLKERGVKKIISLETLLHEDEV